MYKNTLQSLQKPTIYTKSSTKFWDDDYISKQMLDAHLNPEFDGASRKLAFIEKSVAWISKTIPSASYPYLLDVGCGPGIYTERFAKLGYHVTGLDYSKRSIAYAKQSAKEQGLSISYVYQNYLNMDLHNEFDLATMIYCDYGVLSLQERQILMHKIYDALKPGGKLLLDVFSMTRFESFKESKSWEVCENGGFWRADSYIALYGSYKYGENVTLNLTSILSDTDVTPYYLWDTYYTKDSLLTECQSMGFHVCEVFSDVTGTPFSEESETLAILLEK